MLRTDIGMAEFIGGHEGAAERILHARRHADLALEQLVPRLASDSICRLRSSTLILN